MTHDTVLALDLGTTNLKAGLYREGDSPLIQSLPTASIRDENGYYLPERLWEAVRELIGEFPIRKLNNVCRVGIGGMAEAGLLIDRRSGKARSPILPWNVTSGADKLSETPDRFFQTGLPKHSKYSLFKVLALSPPKGETWWLGVPEYVLWRMTGVRQTDPTLAARTYVYDIRKKAWDRSLLESLGLDEDLFPPVFPTGTSPRKVLRTAGLPQEAEAVIGGHDHLAAAYALNTLNETQILISAGTAQVTLAFFPRMTWNQEMYESSLSYGPSPTGSGLVSLSSIQSAGGSVNCWRKWLGLSANEWWSMAEKDDGSTLLYLPYLAGSGAPHLNPMVTARLVGLRQETTREQIVVAIMRGIALETRWTLEKMNLGQRQVVAAGGLSKQSSYMQMLADLLRRPVFCPECEEATLEGAAMLAAGRQLNQKRKTAIYTPQKTESETEEIYRRYCTEIDKQ